MKIVVLAGGFSPEREVSLSSGALIANALMENGHEVLLLDSYCNVGEEAPRFRSGSLKGGYSHAVPDTEPDLEKLRRESGSGERVIGAGVLELCAQADAVFIALHGGAGENGQVQAVLESFGIRHTGTRYEGCLLAMDKDLSKRLMRQGGVRTPDWKLYDAGCGPAGTWAGENWEGGYPCIVKPCDCGSSVGVAEAADREELLACMAAAGCYEDRVLVEKKVEGREFSVGILEGRALPVIEIRPKKGFYDYRNKYQPGMTEEICPADLPETMREGMQRDARKVHELLRLGSYSRIDFLLDGRNEWYCLEANTLPGMTPTSLLPQEAAADGISYRELCERIVRARC